MLAPVTFDYSVRLVCEAEPGAAFVFSLLPARTHQQQLASETLRVRGAAVESVFTEAVTATRYLHVAAHGGPLMVSLDAQVRLLQVELPGSGNAQERMSTPLSAPESLRFLLPSRHCPSDRLRGLAEREFMAIQASRPRAASIAEWVGRRVRCIDALPAEGREDESPSAAIADVLVHGRGTPRDLAHLMIALCRAARLPARYVTTVPYGQPGAVDLHPWVEVLAGDAWIAFDPSRRVPRTALLRIGTGRDAADAPLVIGDGDRYRRRAELSIACVGADPKRLHDSDRIAGPICSATLGSLGEATRWHQEARVAARRQAAAAVAPPPSPALRATRSPVPRSAEVFPFPNRPTTARVRTGSSDTRFEPL
jgi:hypothetical protein